MKHFSLMIFLLVSFTFTLSGQTYILVHGAWHGSWCWDRVIPIMKDKGAKVLAPDLPGHGPDSIQPGTVTLADYVDCIKDVALSTDGPVILVGHSMAGIVISQAAEGFGRNKVSKLIYLDAFLPHNGESVSSLAAMIESALPPDSSRLTIGSGLILSGDFKSSRFKPEIADILFYHDCSAEDRHFAHQRLTPQSFAPLGKGVTVSDSVFGSIPKVYILCTESRDLDKSVLPERVKCEKVIRIKSGHSPFFSMPKRLARILLQA